MTMASRSYRCLVVGSGTEDDPYRPSLADPASEMGANWSAVEITDESHCVVLVAFHDHDAIALLPDVEAIE